MQTNVSSTKYFPYSKAELENLKKCDQSLAGLIERMGKVEREITPDLFTALTHSIISQQISSKAATTVFGRLKNLTTTLVPQALVPQEVDNLSADEIKACGMSFRKANYIKNIASSFDSNKNLSKAALLELSDAEIIKTLTALSGIGVWTAEMMLIFCFCRKNILSTGDLGIKRGLCRLYSLEEISKKQMEFYRSLYAPYASIASLYLWALAGEKI